MFSVVKDFQDFFGQLTGFLEGRQINWAPSFVTVLTQLFHRDILKYLGAGREKHKLVKNKNVIRLNPIKIF